MTFFRRCKASSKRPFSLQRPDLRETADQQMPGQEKRFLKEFGDRLAIAPDSQTLIKRQARMSDDPKRTRENLEKVYPPVGPKKPGGHRPVLRLRPRP